MHKHMNASVCIYLNFQKKIQKTIHYYHFFSDARLNGNVLEYLVRQKDGMPSQTIPSVEAFVRWPSMVLEYLQQHINIVLENVNQSNSAPVDATQAVIGDPIRITCEWFLFRS